ncbi:hypothetical protein HYDPIDRAFT_81673 [Hydnomerulius pinastri MD-312]|nr:hypothetical protein HYDPIDRAFT_81673 [Hydnomerulius pinastri MD-312]
MAAIVLRRSKTAPQPLDEYDTKHATLTRAKSSLNDLSRLHLQQSTTLPSYGQGSLLKNVSPLGTPHEREDPFSLAGFFPPSSRFAPPFSEGERWEWLRHDEDRYVSPRDELRSVYSFTEDEADGSLPPTPGPGVFFARLDEDVAEEAIKGEDKMGVLSLNAIFLARDGHAREDKLYSPYSEEEAVDHESLYLALSRRRHAESVRPVSAGSVGDEGKLFLQSQESTDSAGRTDSWGILQWVVQGLVGLVL